MRYQLFLFDNPHTAASVAIRAGDPVLAIVICLSAGRTIRIATGEVAEEPLARLDDMVSMSTSGLVTTIDRADEVRALLAPSDTVIEEASV